MNTHGLDHTAPSFIAQDSEECLLLDLPFEALDIILTHLDAPGLCGLAVSCSQFRSLVRDESLWRKLAQVSFGYAEAHDLRRTADSATWAELVRVRTGQPIRYWQHSVVCSPIRPCSSRPWHIPALCVHSNGRLLVEGRADGYLSVWEKDYSNRGKSRWKAHVGGAAHRAAHTSGHVTSVQVFGSRIASSGTDGTIALFAVDSGLEVFRNAKASARSEQQRRMINKVRVAAGEGIAADAADDNTCHVYDTSFWELQTKLEGHTMCVYSCAWLDMGNLLATASFDSTVKIWDMRSHCAGHGSMVETLERPMNLHYRAYDVCGAPDSYTLVTSYGDASVRVWDMRMWGLLDTLRGHSRWVESMVLSSKVLVTASADTTVRLWNMASGADRVCSRVCRDHSAVVWGCTFHGPDSVITCSDDGALNEYTAADTVAVPASVADQGGEHSSQAPHSSKKLSGAPRRPRWPSMPSLTAQNGTTGQAHRRTVFGGEWRPPPEVDVSFGNG